MNLAAINLVMKFLKDKLECRYINSLEIQSIFQATNPLYILCGNMDDISLITGHITLTHTTYPGAPYTCVGSDIALR